jgi:murein DD-endopeptidase MepM/ murein hydrolase activator NlpD
MSRPGPQMPLPGKQGLDWRITSPFGWRIHPILKTRRHHNGTDLSGPNPTIPIMSWHRGTVVEAGTSAIKKPNGSLGGVGWYVDVRSKIQGRFYVTRYAHLKANSLKVKKGDRIEAGTVVGIMGNTGESTGRHLHIEICNGKVNKYSFMGLGFHDPLPFIRRVIAGRPV